MYRLPEEMRLKLAKPLGRLYAAAELKESEFKRTIDNIPTVATVGDKVTETLWSLGRASEVQIVDGRENRKARRPLEVPYARLIRTRNPPGTITESAIDAIEEAFRGRKPARIQVEGEEDLLAIPTVMLAPLSAGVVYGQPGVGIVLIRVTQAAKARNRAFLTGMSPPFTG